VSALQLLFAQHELLQLAGGSLWKVRNEAPEARHFVGGEMATAQRFQLRAIRLRTGLRLDESRDNLAPFGVGQADRNVRHRRVGEQHFLDSRG
jgi:hypothetical protein